MNNKIQYSTIVAVLHSLQLLCKIAVFLHVYIFYFDPTTNCRWIPVYRYLPVVR